MRYIMQHISKLPHYYSVVPKEIINFATFLNQNRKNMKAFVFPGQGAQFVGMGKDLYENSALAKELFEKANDILVERIITQKWIAIFPLGIEAWSEYRRTGYPRLLPAVENKSAGTVNVKYGARRIPYPSEEYTENPVHLQEAISMLNGRDNAGTRVWWDVKSLE